MSSPIGVIVGGRPIQVDLVADTSGRLLCEIPQAQTIVDIAVFLTGPGALPAGMGAVISYSEPPYSTWTYAAFLSEQHQCSTIFRVPWAHAAVEPFSLQLSVQVESFEGIESVASVAQQVQSFQKHSMSQAMALDLFRYVESFSGQLSQDWQRVLDSWLKKVQDKERRDPEWWRKIQ